jgi:hypothetical protein
MVKSKSSEVRKVYILVMVAFDLFWKEGFRGETFVFFKGSTSSLGGVTSLGFFSSSTSSSPPRSGDTEGVLLALDQVLGDTWSCFTIFGTSIACRRWSPRQSGDCRISSHFWVPFCFFGICNGKGMSAHGFTHA